MRQEEEDDVARASKPSLEEEGVGVGWSNTGATPRKNFMTKLAKYGASNEEVLHALRFLVERRQLSA